MSSTGKRKTETVDRTFPFTGLGINGSSLQRKNSDSRSTSSNISMDNSFQISNESLMPILLRLKQENQHYLESKESANREMGALESLTKTLLSQNQALRMHYQQRSSDLQQLIQTLSVNWNQNLSEGRHLVHTYKEHNSMLAKQIQEVTEKTRQVEEVAGKLGVQLDRQTATNTRLDDNLRERKVKNKIFEKNIKKLEGKRAHSQLEGLEKQVCDLRLDINGLKKRNMATLKIIKSEKMKMSSEKPEIKTQAIEAIKSVKMLREELSRMEYDYGKYGQDKEALLVKEEELGGRLKDLEAEFHTKKRNMDKLTNRAKLVEGQSKQLIACIQIANSERNKRERQKKGLEEQLETRKKALAKLADGHERRKAELIQEHSRKVSQMRSQMAEMEDKCNQAINFQLNPEQKQGHDTIAHLRSDLETHEKEVEEMKQKVASIPNPIRDIIRLELQLKKLKGRV